jgi:PAS domain S-box-containing protein
MMEPKTTKLRAVSNLVTDYSDFIKGLPVAVYTCDAEGRISSYNHAAVKLWGREPEVGVDMWCGSWKIYQADGTPLPLDSCPMALTLREGKAVSGKEIIIERPDGEKRFILPYPQPLFDEQGSVKGAINMLVDITDKKEKDDLIRESRNKYQQFVDGLPAAAYMCDATGKLLIYNSHALALWGRKPTSNERWCGAWKAYDSNGDPLAISPMQRAFETGIFGTSEELMLERPDGSVKWIVPNLQAVKCPEGHTIAAVNMLLDITEEKKSQQALLESEQKYRELAETLEKKVEERTHSLMIRNAELMKSEERYYKMVEEVQDYAILLLAPDGTILNWNRGAENIKGYKDHEIIGKNFRTFYFAEDRDNRLPEKLIAEAIEKGRAIHEGWRIRKDGTPFWGSTVITSLHDTDRNVIGFSKVTRDLTERKEAENRIKAYNAELALKNKELEQYAYIASHDLQEPLRKILTFSSMLEGRLDDREALKTSLGKIASSAKRMSILINDILNYSRASKEEQQVEINLQQVLKNVEDDLELLISEHQATIVYPPQMPLIKGIPIQLHQLFFNLINNSIKFNRDKPLIQISYKLLTRQETEMHPELSAGKLYYEFILKDNGIGFEEQYAEQIFQLFKRLNDRSQFSGTGLGLALCRRIVENHQGSIKAKSELGKGAEFRIYLPALG